jgi:methylmalonyl-CoA/ethylmalonyl-CoA epimerase
MQYHAPKGKNLPIPYQTHDCGGVRHIALRVSNIQEAFNYLKTIPEVRMISPSPLYRPYKIDTITPSAFYFFDKKMEANAAEKQKICEIISKIHYFYFIDPFGVQWELEQSS